MRVHGPDRLSTAPLARAWARYRRLLPSPTGARGRSEPFLVLGVRDGIAPLGRSGAVHGNMHERRLWTATVEMPIARTDVDHVPRLERVPALPPRANSPAAGHAVEELSSRVPVPMGARGRREVDHPDVGRVGGGDRASQPDLTGEPSGVPALEDAIRRPCYLHDPQPIRAGALVSRGGALRPATMLLA